MGQQKRRSLAIASSVGRVAEFLNAYLYSLRALLSTLPAGVFPLHAPEVVAIGRGEIWPCTDGAVVLIYHDNDRRIVIDAKPPVSRTVNEFLKTSPQMTEHYDEGGRKLPGKPFIQIENASTSMIIMAGNEVSDGDRIFRTRFQKAFIIGWDADVSEPDKMANEDFAHVYIARNIVGDDGIAMTTRDLNEFTVCRSAELLVQARELIASAEREEDVQRFLAQHPEMIYPEFIECYPKYKLGSEFVTDFVFLIQGSNGREYVFVELEKPSKKILTQNGQPSAEFTQAKDQLNNWDRWLTQNLNYAQQTLPNLFRPTYHLIMGTSASLDVAAREKLQIEFRGTTKQFSTYEDVLNRFEAITNRLAS